MRLCGQQLSPGQSGSGRHSAIGRVSHRIATSRYQPGAGPGFNHTSNEHEWVQRALAGDPDYQPTTAYSTTALCLTNTAAPARHLPHGAAAALPTAPIFINGFGPLLHFSVDLNYANPVVLPDARRDAFFGECGVEVLRLDAVAFIWKQLAPIAKSARSPYADPGV